jgi:hypothetical protein
VLNVCDIQAVVLAYSEVFAMMSASSEIDHVQLAIVCEWLFAPFAAHSEEDPNTCETAQSVLSLAGRPKSLLSACAGLCSFFFAVP